MFFNIVFEKNDNGYIFFNEFIFFFFRNKFKVVLVLGSMDKVEWVIFLKKLFLSLLILKFLVLFIFEFLVLGKVFGME